MYYSIPSVRNHAVVHGGSQVDISVLNSLESDETQPADESSETTAVTRQYRVSFECHTSLIIEDMLAEIYGKAAVDSEPTETKVDWLDEYFFIHSTSTQ
jgi:hypothetical protein